MRRILGVLFCHTILCVSIASAQEAPSAAHVHELLQRLQTGDVPAQINAADGLGDLAASDAAIVAALTKALDNEDGVVRWHAARALGSIGPGAAPAANKLMEVLANDKTPAARAYAAYALGRMGEAAQIAVPPLAQAIRDPDRIVRRQALTALRAIKPKPEVMLPLIASILESAEPQELGPALQSLAEQGEAVVPRLIAALQHPRGRYWACLVLGDIGPAAKDAVPALTETLADKDAEVRREALMALGAIGPASKPAVSAITRSLADPDSAVRSAAAFALGRLGPAAAAAIPALEKSRTNLDELTRAVSSWALSRLQPENKSLRAEVIGQLTRAAGNEQARVRAAAVHALADLGASDPAVVAQLGKLLKDPDPGVRAMAADALAGFGEVSVGELTNAVRDPEIRDYGIVALGRVGPAAKAAVPVLIEALADGSPEVRREALFALAAIGPAAEPAVDAIIKSLRSDAAAEVQHAAAFALGRIGPGASRASAMLHQTLDSKDIPLAAISAWALAHIEPANRETAQKSVPLLINALRHPNDVVRAGAAHGLGMLGAHAAPALPALEAALQDSEANVRAAAKEAIAKIKP